MTETIKNEYNEARLIRTIRDKNVYQEILVYVGYICFADTSLGQFLNRIRFMSLYLNKTKQKEKLIIEREKH